MDEITVNSRLLFDSYNSEGKLDLLFFNNSKGQQSPKLDPDRSFDLTFFILGPDSENEKNCVGAVGLTADSTLLTLTIVKK